MRNRGAARVRAIFAAAMLSSALGAACSDPPPPITPVIQPLSDGRATLTPQAPQTPLREEHPNQPDSVNACVDAWLGRHQLNEYADPPGTMYAGGTPLFNERTGQRTDRMIYLFAKNAQLRADCAPHAKP